MRAISRFQGVAVPDVGEQDPVVVEQAVPAQFDLQRVQGALVVVEQVHDRRAQPTPARSTAPVRG
jgi:hypothetical protein